MCLDKNHTFQIHVGTSGWTYDDWEGRFYPRDVKGTARLDYYMSVFDAVEVNATFYRVPNQATINSWNRRLGPGFHLVVKGSRVVTHFKKLVGCDDALELFLDRVLQQRLSGSGPEKCQAIRAAFTRKVLFEFIPRTVYCPRKSSVSVPIPHTVRY